MIKKSIALIAIIPTLLMSEGQIRTPRTPEPQEIVELPGFRRKLKGEQKRNQKQFKDIRKWFQPKLMYTEMNFEELKAAKIKRVEAEQWDVAIRYLQRLIILCEDVNEKADLIIELANIQFDQGFFDDAAKQFKEFIHLYPGNKHTEFAHYKSIVCTHKRILSSDRDQTKTEETIELANKFLDQNTFNEYREQVLELRQQCFQVLAHSELNIGEFYINSGEYLAAQRRLETVRTDLLEKAPEIELRLAHLEADLSLQFSDFKPPESSLIIADAAKELKPKKKDMAARF